MLGPANLDPSSTVSGEGSLFTFPHACSGENRAMFVCICYVPDQDQEVVSVTYGGVPLTRFPDVTQIRSDVYEEFWYVVAPPLGTADVSVTLSASAKTTCAAASANGIAQSSLVYFKSNGVGDMVAEIPLVCQASLGNMLLGFGACAGSSGVPVEAWQTLVWDVAQGDNIRSQCIASFPNFTAQINVVNRIAPAAKWSVDILGIRAA